MTGQLQLVQVLLAAVLLGVIAGALVFDLIQRRIPNTLTFGGAAAGVTLQLLLGGPDGFLAAAGGLGVGLAVLLPGYLLRFTGAGDVKLMAAVGAFLGPFWALVAGLTSIAAGAVIAAGFAAATLLSGAASGPWRRYGFMLRGLAITGQLHYVPPAEGEVMGRRFPFAAAIALGTTATLALWWPGHGAVGHG